jgi:protein SCO1/2
MKISHLFLVSGLGCLLSVSPGAAPAQSTPAVTNVRTFDVSGTVRRIEADGRTLVVAHDAVSNYMAAMTMPFKARDAAELKGLHPGDAIRFHLLVTEDDSWIEHITRMGRNSPATIDIQPPTPVETRPHPLLSCPFTNELGRTVTLADFKGQALAITFFFTRCPIPNYCPRLSKNFEEASEKLRQTPNAPTNWHMLSISFDTAFDTPAVLKLYAEQYHYDSSHWSFLTGPQDKITELANQSNVSFERDGGFFNHNFRTLIIDAKGHLQMSFPIGGNLSEAIAGELIKACAPTNTASRPEVPAAPDPH